MENLAVVQPAQPTEISTTDIMMNVPLMLQIDALAARMASALNTVPKHLQNNAGDCWAVIMQAMQWRMNPFAVAQKTHIVNGHLGYEAQLVNAVIQNSGMVTSPFRYEYKGEGAALECRVGAVLKGDPETTWTEWLCIATVKVKNSPLWTTNPRQQMGYLQSKNWARLYCPGAILGVYTPDELQELGPRVEREVGPVISDLTETLKAQTPPPAPAPKRSPKKAPEPESPRIDEHPHDARVRDIAEEGVVVQESAVVDDLPWPDAPEEQAPEPTLPSYADVTAAINAAHDPASLQAAVTLMTTFLGTCQDADVRAAFKDELSGLYRWKLADLKAAK